MPVEPRAAPGGHSVSPNFSRLQPRLGLRRGVGTAGQVAGGSGVPSHQGAGGPQARLEPLLLPCSSRCEEGSSPEWLPPAGLGTRIRRSPAGRPPRVPPSPMGDLHFVVSPPPEGCDRAEAALGRPCVPPLQLLVRETPVLRGKSRCCGQRCPPGGRGRPPAAPLRPTERSEGRGWVSPTTSNTPGNSGPWSGGCGRAAPWLCFPCPPPPIPSAFPRWQFGPASPPCAPSAAISVLAKHAAHRALIKEN